MPIVKPHQPTSAEAERTDPELETALTAVDAANAAKREAEARAIIDQQRQAEAIAEQARQAAEAKRDAEAYALSERIRVSALQADQYTAMESAIQTLTVEFERSVSLGCDALAIMRRFADVVYSNEVAKLHWSGVLAPYANTQPLFGRTPQ